MNAKLWACIIMGVLVMHLSVLFIVDHLRTMRTAPPRTAPPEEPGFTTTTTTFTDGRGEKVKVVHEFTVRTELADPRALEKLPAPPKPDAVGQAGSAAPAEAN